MKRAATQLFKRQSKNRAFFQSNPRESPGGGGGWSGMELTDTLHQSTPTDNNHSFTTSANEQQDGRSEIQESNEHNNTDNNRHRDEILNISKVKFEEAGRIDFSLRKRFQKPPKPKMKKSEESIKEANEVMTKSDFCVDDFTDFNCLLYATTQIAIERADLEKENPNQPKHRGKNSTGKQK